MDSYYGDPIPGSKYFRAFCELCEEPIRVAQNKLFDQNGEPFKHFCTDCNQPLLPPPSKAENLTPRQAAKLHA
jgi:hypothetical protein